MGWAPPCGRFRHPDACSTSGSARLPLARLALVASFQSKSNQLAAGVHARTAPGSPGGCVLAKDSGDHCPGRGRVWAVEMAPKLKNPIRMAGRQAYCAATKKDVVPKPVDDSDADVKHRPRAPVKRQSLTLPRAPPHDSLRLATLSLLACSGSGPSVAGRVPRAAPLPPQHPGLGPCVRVYFQHVEPIDTTVSTASSIARDGVLLLHRSTAAVHMTGHARSKMQCAVVLRAACGIR
jgi:hypothetical protein